MNSDDVRAPNAEPNADDIDLRADSARSVATLNRSVQGNEDASAILPEEMPGIVWDPPGGERVSDTSDYDGLLLMRDEMDPTDVAAPHSVRLALRRLDRILRNAENLRGTNLLSPDHIRGALRDVGVDIFEYGEVDGE